MPTHDDSADDPTPPPKGGAAPDLVPLASALRARPQPRKPRRREAAVHPASLDPPPSIDEQLDRAETCSRSGRIDEAIAICLALRGTLRDRKSVV